MCVDARLGFLLFFSILLMLSLKIWPIYLRRRNSLPLLSSLRGGTTFFVKINRQYRLDQALNLLFHKKKYFLFAEKFRNFENGKNHQCQPHSPAPGAARHPGLPYNIFAAKKRLKMEKKLFKKTFLTSFQIKRKQI